MIKGSQSRGNKMKRKYKIGDTIKIGGIEAEVIDVLYGGEYDYKIKCDGEYPFVIWEDEIDRQGEVA